MFTVQEFEFLLKNHPILKQRHNPMWRVPVACEESVYFPFCYKQGSRVTHGYCNDPKRWEEAAETGGPPHLFGFPRCCTHKDRQNLSNLMAILKRISQHSIPPVVFSLNRGIQLFTYVSYLLPPYPPCDYLSLIP